MNLMTFCFVYKSAKKEHCYLYMQKENEFEKLPEAIQTYFGKPIFVMKLSLISGKRYPVGTVEMIKERLETDGFLIQLLEEDHFKVISEV